MRNFQQKKFAMSYFIKTVPVQKIFKFWQNFAKIAKILITLNCCCFPVAAAAVANLDFVFTNTVSVS